MGLFNKKYLRQIAQLQERLSSLENQLSDERSKNEKYGIYKYEDSVEKIDKLNGDAKPMNSILRTYRHRYRIKAKFLTS